MEPKAPGTRGFLRRPGVGRPGIWILLLGVVVIAAAAAVPRVALPRSWMQPWLSSVEEHLGIPLEVGRATWNGWNRLTFRQVEGPWSWPGAEGSARAQRVEVEILPSDFLPLDSVSARRIRIEELTLSSSWWDPASLPEALTDLLAQGPLRIQQAILLVSPQGLEIEELTFSHPWMNGRLTGRLSGLSAPSQPVDGQPAMVEGAVPEDARLLEDVRLSLQDVQVEMQVELAEVSVAWLAAWLQGLRESVGQGVGQWDGRLQASVHVSGPAMRPLVRWQVGGTNLIWQDTPWHTHGYRVQELSAAGMLEGGRLEITSLSATLAGATGGARRLELAGAWDATGGWDLQLSARGLQLAEDVPVLEAWGVQGTGDFTGRLEGSWSDPRLTGRVEMGPGRLWHQAVDAVAGTLHLTSRELVLQDALVSSGEARYRLEGTIRFPGALAEDGSVDLVLESTAGRAEDLLTVLGWGDLPVVGTLDGVLEFSGSFGNVQSRGDVRLTSGTAWQQPFDEVTGSYRWDGQGVQLVDGVFRLRGGRGAFNGYVGSDGSVDVAVEAAGLLLESLTAVHKASQRLLSGRVDFSGHIGGSLQQPRWEAQVNGRRLKIGPLTFESGRGEIVLDATGWEVRDLELTRPSGATYLASGWVDAPDELPPLMHLLVDVQGETLEDALSLLGIRLVLPIVSGRVQGRALVTGELEHPDGEIYLSVDDAQWAGRPTGLTVAMEVAGGQVRVKELQLGPPVQANARG